MKQSNSFERRVGIKISLLFFIVFIYVIGIFIYSYNLKKNIDNQKKEVSTFYALLSQTNQLILSIQQAQELMNAYLITPQKNFQQKYDSISTIISQQITEVRKLTSPKYQEFYLVDVDSLLHEKNMIVNQLIIQFRSKSPLKDLDKEFETYDKFIQAPEVVTTSKDTTIIFPKKKRFWTRLKNLISPTYTPDSIVKVQETRLTSIIDTALYSNLKDITQEASKTYSSQISVIEKQVAELILAEQKISLQISQLLTKFHKDTARLTRQGIHNSEQITRRIFIFAFLVGALSLLIILIILFLIIDDLKEGQKARLDLTKEKQLTESLMESRHQLLLSVSHDIKTPLSSIMGYIEMWSSENASDSKKKQLQSAHNSGTHILSMLTNLLEFSRLERSATTLHRSRFDIVVLMEEIISMFEPLAQEKNLLFTFDNHTLSPLFVETDYMAIKQILINVLSNALKYTIKGKINIELRYENNLIFTVTDTGIGMCESDIREIYKPFSRIKNPLNAEGSGFGMYVTKGLIESLGGEIQIKSEESKGTQVSIHLPVSLSTTLSNATVNISKQAAYHKILIFEDDTSLGNMIKAFLMQNGYKVKVCSNNIDVDGFINHLSLFDIVFTDMQMLNVTGDDILEKIRKRDSEIPVWLMTAHDDFTTQKATTKGFSGFIKKPIQMNQLVEILSGKEGKETFKAKETGAFNDKFPKLVELFGDDRDAITDILIQFVQTSREDTAALKDAVKNNNFIEAQEICHRIYPFLCQIGADNLCTVLLKFDSLRGEDETAYPAWKEDLLLSLAQINAFTNEIENEYLRNEGMKVE